MQRHPAFPRDAVSDPASELRVQRQHGSENFAERRKVVIGNPAAQAQKLIIENRSDIELIVTEGSRS
jgi:hypothetical protein